MGGRGERKCVLVVMESKNQGYLVFNIRIRDLFQSRPRPAAAATRTEMRTLPSPAGQIPTLDGGLTWSLEEGLMESIDFALASASGDTMVGVSSRRRTVSYDTRSGQLASSPGPEHCKLEGSFVVPMGRRIYALQRRFGVFAKAQHPSGEVRDPAAAGSGWRPLPEPPPDFRCTSERLPTCDLTACLAGPGARLWVSAKDRGTYSLDTARGGAWRKDGAWELPFCGRGVFVPDLDGLCFGICAQRCRLLAVDMGQSPPAVRYRWEDTFPLWVRENDGCALFPESSLVYLGGGRFCIAWTVGMCDAGSYSLERLFIHVMALQLIKTSTSSGREELRLNKHKVCCYSLPSHAEMAHLV